MTDWAGGWCAVRPDIKKSNNNILIWANSQIAENEQKIALTKNGIAKIEKSAFVCW